MEGMTTREYFFYEWLIVEKKMTSDNYFNLKPQELTDLRVEYLNFEAGLRG